MLINWDKENNLRYTQTQIDINKEKLKKLKTNLTKIMLFENTKRIPTNILEIYTQGDKIDGVKIQKDIVVQIEKEIFVVYVSDTNLPYIKNIQEYIIYIDGKRVYPNENSTKRVKYKENQIVKQIENRLKYKKIDEIESIIEKWEEVYENINTI